MDSDVLKVFRTSVYRPVCHQLSPSLRRRSTCAKKESVSGLTGETVVQLMSRILGSPPRTFFYDRNFRRFINAHIPSGKKNQLLLRSAVKVSDPKNTRDWHPRSVTLRDAQYNHFN
ncbi:hypothetical protein BDZ89DRAFT_1077646 [Hymenopellis radicata]|nr:hypothetical protein BDZ89DRAFT_1077646 [Hymenopellis radicata]